jgi:sodium-dependent dicarboxylate transporter 2/3/5
LIAGGLSLGQLAEDSELAQHAAASVPWHQLPPTLLLLVLIIACALVSAVSSNTAAAVIVLQIAMGLSSSSPAIVVLVAVSASMGVPFVISTPPNALVYGQLLPGAVLMSLGRVLLALAGLKVLHFVGVP